MSTTVFEFTKKVLLYIRDVEHSALVEYVVAENAIPSSIIKSDTPPNPDDIYYLNDTIPKHLRWQSILVLIKSPEGTPAHLPSEIKVERWFRFVKKDDSHE
jgi:hypothetical protein